MSTPPSPNDLTRQQLDELDDLLQRMLTLPVSGATPTPDPEPVEAPLPEVPAVPSGNWRSDPPTLAKSPYLAEPSPRLAPELVPSVAPEPEPEPELPAWGPDPLARYGASPAARLFAPPTPDTGVPPTGTVRGVDAPALPAGFRSLFDEEAELPPLAVFTPAPAPEPKPAREPRPYSVPVALWPMFGLNWVLELLLKLLGPLGSMVTLTPTKHLLGLTGVLLLAASAVWAARGMGWVAFDVPPLPQLPWQR
jgi:hypothetical protein